MNGKNLVSVVMAVYNTPESYFREAIESVLKQTLKNFELLIIDVCSNNLDVLSIVNSYHDQRIKLFKTDHNEGAANARNIGLKKSTGKYIAILDSDDIAIKDRLEKQMSYLEKNIDIGVLGSWAEVFPVKTVWKPYEKFRFLDILKFSPWLIHSSIMLRASVIKENNLIYDTSYIPCEDYHLWSRLIRFTKIRNLQEVLVKYRAGEGISFRRKEEMLLQSRRIKKELLGFLTDNPVLQDNILGLLHERRTNKKFIYKIKYVLYKTLWLIGGKGNFFKEKMKRTRNKLKGKI